MNELEKCLAGQWYDCHDSIFLEYKDNARRLLQEYHALPIRIGDGLCLSGKYMDDIMYALAVRGKNGRQDHCNYLAGRSADSRRRICVS